MKIIQISTSDSAGGAAIAAYRLHRSLLKVGCGSSMFVLRRRHTTDDTVFQLGKPTSLPARIARKTRQMWLDGNRVLYCANRPAGLEKFTDERSGFYKAFLNEIPQVDALHFHWTADFVRLGDVIRRIGGKIPLIFTLHDMNLFTGGCHYDLDCGKFKTECLACPQLGSRKNNDRANKNFRSKKTAFSKLGGSDVRIVCPSNWIAQEAAASDILKHLQIEVIANGIDLGVFCQKDRMAARRVFEIPDQSQVLLFVSDATSNTRKGLDLLCTALKGYEDRQDLVLLTVGHGVPANIPSIPHIHLGSIHPENLLASVYSAADIFIGPYQQDNLPNTIIESMACGTPVIAFNIGGIPEIIDDGENGILVAERNPEALREAITSLLEFEADRQRLASACRPSIERKFSDIDRASQYVRLYESLVNQAS